ncbi:MAG: STAS domain-containing protein [Pyrinomonadaceae bacterium]|nr:STAS domain-containing protein [Pyrinomonadaceae bacterium]
MLKVQAKNLGPVAVLRLDGQIVNGDTATLRNAVRSLSAVNAVRLDLASVTTVDAGGLGAMLELREWTQAKGIRFELMNVTKRISMLLRLTRLDSVFQIANGVEFFPAASHSRGAQAASFASCA